MNLILADEPTGNLDTATQKEIVSIFRKLSTDYEACVIVVTHSDDVARTSDIQLKLVDGKLVDITGHLKS